MKLRRSVLALVAMTVLSSQAVAQLQEKEQRRVSGPRRQLATIIFAGLGGAVLGLSTLSFYGRPQEKLSNIAIGFAVGVIAGTVFVTYRSATSREFLDEEAPPSRQGSLVPPERAWQIRPDVSFGEGGPSSKDVPVEKHLGATLAIAF